MDALLSAWRAKALSAVLVWLAIIILPAVVLIQFAQGLVLPGMARGVSLALFLILVVTIWRRDWSVARRVRIFFFIAYSLTALQFFYNGLLGNGRIVLVLLPPVALVLIGKRAGWIAMGVSVVMFVGFALLAGIGRLAGHLIVRENSTDAGVWLIQIVLWLAALVPLMVLLTRFLELQANAMIEEHRARLAIETAEAERRRLEQEITRISEEEQRRLGSELHDGLCQQLTAALLDCTAIEHDLSARGAAESSATKRLRGLLEDCIGSAYDVAKGLCPVDMEAESLAPALQRLARRTHQTAGVACELREHGDLALLDPQATLHLYRIAREAVGNAVKHARCRRIILELRGSAEACILRVMDDGQSPAPGPTSRPGGMGKQIMHYRAKTIGGTLTIDYPPSGGTVVNCQVPLISRPVAPPELRVTND